jgi:hypothetical protein
VSAADNDTIRGVVVDERGQPMPHFTVRCFGANVIGMQTSAAGEFVFRNRTGTEYCIELFETNAARTWRPAKRVTARRPWKNLNITIYDRELQRGSITGSIVGPDGARIGGASVRAYYGHSKYFETATNAEGFFEISALQGGDYEVRIAHPDYRDIKIPGVGVEGRRDLGRLTAARGERVSIETVYPTHGMPDPAAVKLWRFDSALGDGGLEFADSGVTQNGAWTSKPLVPGEYVALATDKSGYNAGVSEPFHIRPGENATAQIQMAPVARVWLQLIEPSPSAFKEKLCFFRIRDAAGKLRASYGEDDDREWRPPDELSVHVPLGKHKFELFSDGILTVTREITIEREINVFNPIVVRL